MDKKKPQYPTYPRETMKDEFAKWLLAAYKEIPGGELTSAVFGTFWRPVIERKREEFFDDLAKDIWILKDKYEQFQPENLKQNEGFLNMTLEVVDRVMRTSQKERIKRLRNFLLNGIIDEKAKESEKRQILSIIDWIEEDQLFILEYFLNQKHTVVGFDHIVSGGIYDDETEIMEYPDRYRTNKKIGQKSLVNQSYSKFPIFTDIISPYEKEMSTEYNKLVGEKSKSSGLFFYLNRHLDLLNTARLLNIHPIDEEYIASILKLKDAFMVIVVNTTDLGKNLLNFIKDPTSS